MSIIKNITALYIIILLFSCNNQQQQAIENNPKAESEILPTPDSNSLHTEMKTIMDSMMVKMHNPSSSGNIDMDYAWLMLQHHQAAINMAQLQLKKGSSAVLKEFSKKIIEDQGKEASLMGEFISTTKAGISDSIAVFKTGIDSAINKMMKNGVKIYNEIDKDFVAQMIPHHQAAVDMAKIYLLHQQSSVLKQVSEAIIMNQEKDLGWLRDWLAANG